MDEPVSERPHMPDYGVERDGWAALPWSWAAARLVPARNYWLVTVSAAGRPHTLPVWGVWDDSTHRFGFSCGPRSRKAANLAANPAVVVTPGDTVEVVSVEGTATILTDAAGQAAWIDRYVAKYQQLGEEVSPDFLRENLIVEVVPDRAFAVIERAEEFAARATRWRFS